jgi:DNA replication protein DnaC
MVDTKTRDYYLLCGIKSGLHGKTLDDFTNDEDALEKVKKYIRKSRSMYRDGLGLYLWGSNGTGKTHLMGCSFMELISKGYKVRLFSMDEIVDKFTSSWYSDEDRHELNNILRNIDFLGIDEFGKNVDKDGNPVYLPDLVKRVMESVIRFRVQMNKPIWITSNTDPKYVNEVFSEDVASLLNEAVVPICVRGADFRKTILKRNKKKLL